MSYKTSLRRLALLLLGVACLTAAFAPVDQFYLAWVGLIPWLLVLDGTRSRRSAFFWSWLFGTLFFIANSWWMAYITAPGMVCMMAILGLYWGVTGVVLRTLGLFGAARMGGRRSTIEDRTSRIEEGAESSERSSRSSIFDPRSSIFLRLFLTAATFVAVCEWFRGAWPWGGLAWLYMGYTQSPVPRICQIVDITGVGGLSFVIVLANAWLAILLMDRRNFRRMIPSGVGIIGIIIGLIVYGDYRFSHEQLNPGPTVMVVQPNYPQSNTGAKGADLDERLAFHLNATMDARPAAHHVDLIVWSETMMPSMNAFTLEHLRNTQYGDSIQLAIDAIGQLCRKSHAALLTGAEEWRHFDIIDGYLKNADKRNISYYFHRDGVLQDQVYAKIHLVPFGEFIPFKEGFPAFYRLLLKFGPPDMDQYNLTRGDEEHLTVFSLNPPTGGRPWTFVTPICFEDFDPDLCAKMVRPDPAEPDRKRAEFLVNITNDGWFKANENAQHLQAAIFRSIEDRVPTARSVNTGISGFIDPLGRTSNLLEVRTEGTSISMLLLDPRVTIFTCVGQLFSRLCAGVTLSAVLASLIIRGLRRSKEHTDFQARGI
jgi:apolipoprotein N-acyltransferase